MQAMNPDELKARYPEKCAQMDRILSHIRRGGSIFISTACGKPQFLVQSIVEHVGGLPKSCSESETIQVWTMGVAPYFDDTFKDSFRYNSFFIGNATRDAVNAGLADYTPISLSLVPALFRRRMVEIDVAIIQTSPPDRNGMMSLGISIDIVKAAVENAALVVAQVNARMPRVHGDTFIHIDEVDFVVPHDEELIEFHAGERDDAAEMIGRQVARLVRDGDTIQVGYGSLPSAIMQNLSNKKNLGVHTELLSDGIVDLIRCGAIDNSRKIVDRWKTVATFCMGSRSSYDFLHDNPTVSFRTIDYTNDPLIISRQENMVAINSALQIDLTGQASAESCAGIFYSGIGGQADFMRGALLSPGGRTILTIKSTAENGTVSRIVPMLDPGTGVTLNRGDIQYVVTEFGLAFIQGKNIRERAMDLIAIAHPDFRPWLLDEAKRLGLVDERRFAISGTKGRYPQHLETHRMSNTGLRLLLRQVTTSDEGLLRSFFQSLPERDFYTRFVAGEADNDYKRIGDFVSGDFSNRKVIIAQNDENGRDSAVGIGICSSEEFSYTARVSIAVQDSQRNGGIGTEILLYLINLARRDGLFSLSADVFIENKPMLHLCEKCGFSIEKSLGAGIYELALDLTEERYLKA